MSPSPRTAEIMGVNLRLGTPDTTDQSWIGQGEVLRQLLACWLVVDPADRPLSPRLVGPPGIGKTTLAMAAARERKQPLFIAQCTADTRPEDRELVGEVVARAASIARDLGLEHYRLVANNGEGAGQTVFHLHFHLLGGRPLAWPPG